MSDLAAIIMAWSAVHFVVGVHNLSIHLRRPTDLEYLSFAMLSFGFSFYTYGAALLTDASSYAEGTIAMRFAYIGAPVAAGSFVVFAALLSGAQGARVVRAAIVWSALGLFASLAGLLFDPDHPALSSPYQEPKQTVVAVIWVIGACAFIGWTLYWVLRRSRTDRDLRLLTWGALLTVAAAIYDQVVHLLSLPSPYLLEHAAVGVSLLLSYMLLRRLAGTESELERRTAEVAASYRDLRRAQDDLIQKEQLAAVGELSAVIAHEIRNPLAILRNAASGLKRSALSPEDRKTLLSILDEESDRLSRLSRDLAMYAQPLTPSSAPTSIRELVSEGVREVVENGTGTSVELDDQVGEGPELILGDRKLLHLAFRNVFDNAVQAMPAGGKLTVRARTLEQGGRDAIVFDIEDTGEGMDTLVKDKALDPFFTTRASGTGLGLAIVDRVIRAHGGRVEIESSFGKGTVVRVSLPLTHDPGP